MYYREEVNGISLLFGPTGGGCSMTSRELHDRVGGFRQKPETGLWLEDAAYIADIQKLGFRAAYLDDLKVLRAGGPYYSPTPPEKAEYWADFYRRIARKDAVKRFLLRVPLLARLNVRYRWFQPPEKP